MSSRRIRLLLAAVALMVAMITASAAPAVALDDVDVELFRDGDDICAAAVGEEDDNDVFDDNGDDNDVFDDNSVFDDSTETETECEDIEDLLSVDEAGFFVEEDFLF
jgi:hypothetical protein